MTRLLAALAASVLVIACGVVHGFWSDRWRQPVETTEAANRLDALPLEVGDWHGTVVEVKNPTAGGVAGTLSRHYENGKTGDAVSVYMVCGRAGPASIHTPEACYGGSGYDLSGKSRVDVRPEGGAFWSADAVKTKVADVTRLRLYWGWNDGKGWTAPDDARWTFVAYRHSPLLYKMYVLRDLNGGAQASKDEPCQAFLQAMLPEMDRTLFAPGS
jgi:Protein of unknown function (DUF3485)